LVKDGERLINKGVRGDEATMLNNETILKTLSENLSEVQKYNVDQIGLFGSYIRDEQSNDSDIDILVNFKTGKKSFDTYMDLKFYLEDLFKQKIDLVIADALKPDLKNNILESVKYVT
jgi:uncharacterized protein